MTCSSCAAFLRVKIIGDMYYVTYCITHTSHELEIEHLRINTSFKQGIASKLKMGVNIKSILKDIRENNDSSYSQMKYVTRKEIENIISKEGINLEYQLDSNDAHSVDKFVQKDGGKTVLLYKPCGVSHPNFSDLNVNDFALGLMNEKQIKTLLDAESGPTSIICADATHGTSKYQIKLITLLAVDSLGKGMPCAFFFSTREDQVALSYFFQSVKSRIGRSLQPKIFMTDDAGAYWNAFLEVMDCQSTKRLLCVWHVDKNWRKQLIEKVKDTLKKSKIYKQLCILRLEPDVEKFNQMLTNFLSRCKKSSDTKEFAKYFESEYSNRTKLWAACYRHHSYINTNMYLESMHKTLKYSVFEKKSIRRMDRAIYLVSVCFDEMYAKFERMLVKPTATRKTSDIFRFHKKSLSENENFLIEKVSEFEFIVKHKTDKSTFQLKLNHPGKHPCHLLCKMCKFCIHTFICSCRDNRYKGQFCIHLHLLSTAQHLLPKYELPDHPFFNFLNSLNLNNRTNLAVNQKEVCQPPNTDKFDGQLSSNQDERNSSDQNAEFESCFNNDGIDDNFCGDIDIDYSEDKFSVVRSNSVPTSSDLPETIELEDSAQQNGLSVEQDCCNEPKISTCTNQPVLDQIEAFDHEMNCAMLIWQQLKKEAKTDESQCKLVSENLHLLKEELVAFSAKMLSISKSSPGLDTIQNQYHAQSVSKQIRFETKKGAKRGRKRKHGILKMAETPEKCELEGNLLDPNYQSPKKKKTQAKRNPRKKILSKDDQSADCKTTRSKKNVSKAKRTIKF